MKIPLVGHERSTTLEDGLSEAAARFAFTVEGTLPVHPRFTKPLYEVLAPKVYEPDIVRRDISPAISPYEPIWFDPDDVQQITGRVWKPWEGYMSICGAVRDGDWDVRPPQGVPELFQPYPKEFEGLVMYESFREHFEEGRAWEETTYYGHLRRVAEEYQESKRFDGPSDVLPYLQRFDELFRDIEANRYRTQLDLCSRWSTYERCLRNEIMVDIDRNGEILFVENRHRLAIAKLLELDRVPGVVLIRHEDWVRELEDGATPIGQVTPEST